VYVGAFGLVCFAAGGGHVKGVRELLGERRVAADLGLAAHVRERATLAWSAASLLVLVVVLVVQRSA
jgi:hypothetical protein